MNNPKISHTKYLPLSSSLYTLNQCTRRRKISSSPLLSVLLPALLYSESMLSTQERGGIPSLIKFSSSHISWHIDLVLEAAMQLLTIASCCTNNPKATKQTQIFMIKTYCSLPFTLSIRQRAHNEHVTYQQK